jgi:hypothetical protein
LALRMGITAAGETATRIARKLSARRARLTSTIVGRSEPWSTVYLGTMPLKRGMTSLASNSIE